MWGLGLPCSCLLPHAWKDSRVPGWSPSEASPPGGRLTPQRVAQVLTEYRTGGTPPTAFTRGLYKKGYEE